MTRVVVVDDDYMVARVHSAFVERVPGCTVVGSAADGAGALRVVRELLPDVVLLDVYMPDMTGLEVLRELRASAGPEADVDVLMVTAADDAESVRRALRGGVGGYLIKPFHAEDLRRRLEHLVAARRRLAELPDRPGAAQSQVDRLVTPGLPHDGGRAAAEGPVPRDDRAGPAGPARRRAGRPVGQRVRRAHRPVAGQRPPLPRALLPHRRR